MIALFDASGALEKVQWSGPPRGSTVSVTIDVDGQVLSQGTFAYNPRPAGEVCGSQCYETPTHTLQ